MKNETYFGGKGADGVYQTIINQIPPHEVWVSGFLGHCAVTRHKKPATLYNAGFELSDKAIGFWEKQEYLDVDVIQHSFFSSFAQCLLEVMSRRELFLYLDPPYLQSTRTSNHKYEYELSDEDHIRLINYVKDFPAMVAISHYPCHFYDCLLTTGRWRKIEFTGQTRAGGRTEALYMNYPEPTELHDYRYLGQDFREREAIKRRRQTILGKIDRLRPSEKAALLQELSNL